MKNKLFVIGTLFFALLFFTQCLRKPKNEFERARDFVKSQCTEKFFKEKDPTFISIEV